jgi:DNA-binding MarR family transcriptional regulator
MQGFYNNSPRSIGECEEFTACSRPTTRTLLRVAQDKGFLEIRASGDDQRKRLIHPTSKTISEYELMVKGYMQVFKVLRKRK